MPIVKTDVYDVQAPFALDLRLVKADMNARNAIGTFQRYVGMTVFVLADNTFWQLQGGTTNDDWVEVDGSSGIVMQSVVVNSGAPTGGSDGDIWFQQVGNTVTVYQRVSGTWTALGVIEVGGPSLTPDPSLPNTGTLAYLNSTYPSASIRDVVYREVDDQLLWCENYAAGKWTKQIINAAT